MDYEEIYPGYYRFVTPRKPDQATQVQVANAFEKAFQGVKISNTGSGAVAVGVNAAAAGKGGVVINGDVQGDVVTGSGD